jgi:hypothetical protein
MLGQLFTDSNINNHQNVGTNLLAKLANIEPLSARNKPISCRNSSSQLKNGLFFNNFVSQSINFNIKAVNFNHLPDNRKDHIKKDYVKNENFNFKNTNNHKKITENDFKKSPRNITKTKDLKDTFQNFQNFQLRKI